MELQSVNNVEFTETGLTIKDGITINDWLKLGKTLDTMQGAIQWWIGDWLNYGEKKYGEMYSQALSDSKYGYQALADMKWVASRIKFSLRKESLNWSHYKEVAGLTPKQQSHYLEFAEKEKLSVRALREMVKPNEMCDCTIQDMEEKVIYEYTCKHGKKIRQVAQSE